MTLISARNLDLTYGSQQVLHNIDLDIHRGEIVTVIGPNGSGKSTLMRALLGAKSPQSGRIMRKPGLRIGYVPQRLAVETAMPLTVKRFLSLPVRHRDAAVSAMLDRVGVPGYENRQLSGLSGGQFQRVVLARALLGAPDILILDEPTQGLDQPGIAGVYALLEDVRRETGCAVLLVSHDLHVVMSASDRVICLNGHICCEGTPTVVADAPEYHALFGHGTHGTMALYQHEHDAQCDHTRIGKGGDHAR
jgi:zinc transport system ATP-binding protein